MSCAGSERVGNSKGFDCRNMGDVLGKECEKEETSLTQSVEDVLRDEGEGAASSGTASESDSDKDFSLDSDEDLSWLLPINTMELLAKKCKCEGCLKLFKSYNNDKRNAKLLLSSWKEFRNYIRNVYINSPLESAEKNENVSFEDNERLHEIIQVMRFCDPYQLFQKIEDEVCSMIHESRIRQLNLLKDESNPALAEEFIAGLIGEYVKLLSSALQLSPAIETLLGPQLQRFGLTWEVLNKQLYRSLVYNHLEVQQNLLRFIEQLRKMLPLKDDLYHELVHQYLAFDGEMTLIGTMWKNVEPLIQEYRNLKSKENEKLNNLLDAMKDFFANKLCTADDDLDETHDENACSTSDDALQYCPNCMTRRGCPCDECTVTHMMSCEDILLGIESPLEANSPSRSRSRSPIKQAEPELKENGGEREEEQQSCECHACTMPPPDLMDCSAAFSQTTGKTNIHGEGFQLYPHIHGTTSEAENVSNIYAPLQTTSDSVYPHLYNLHNQSNSVDNQSQMNSTVRNHLMQAISPNKVNPLSKQSVGSPPPPPPPPPVSQESIPLPQNSPQSVFPPKSSSLNSSVKLTPEKLEQLVAAQKSIEKSSPSETVKEEKSKVLSSKPDGKKIDVAKKAVVPKESESMEKIAPVKPPAKSQGSSKENGCVISRLCGKCCLKHGSNCLKMSGCSKGSDKHLAAIARLGLSGNSNSRVPMRCVGGKNDHSHKTAKSHSCNKSKHQENARKIASKKGHEVDDSTSPEDSCSEASNSTAASAQKDARHCDCCYCEVFGHGVPSVAPVSRNYQEMRERLRLRLNMKKSAKCKTTQPVPVSQPVGQKVVGVNPKPPVTPPVSQVAETKKSNVREQDIESLIKYIEGKKGECKDAKKAAKKARQKQKKLREKERLEEEEEERKRLEAVKRQVTISLVNNNSNNNKRSQNVKQTARPQVPPPVQKPSNQRLQPQTLNLSGLKSLVEKSDPNSVPKMVTIRRVMAPFSSEPTVTITLKGSTPDKDKVLFMLKNDSDCLQPEEKENSKKKKKKKKKAQQQEEDEDICEEEYQPIYQPPVEEVTSKKKKKKKNKNSEEPEYSEPVFQNLRASQLLAKNVSLNKPSKPTNSKNVSVATQNSGNSKLASLKASNNKVQNQIKPQPQNTKSTPVTNTKANSQKNVPVLKAQNQNVKNQNAKNQNSVTKPGKNDSIASKKSVQNNSSVKVSKSSVSSSELKSASVKNNQKGVLTNSQIQNCNSAPKQKNKKEKNQIVSTNSVSEKQTKGQKKEVVQQPPRVVQASQTKNKANEPVNKVSQKNIKNLVQLPPAISQKLQNNQRINNLEILQVQKDKSNKKAKSNKKTSTDDVEINWKGPPERYDRGKVIINTPSYRLSEVLNSIAPSPPPKEEINLENLRLPPGITITKIEGPIAKPIKPAVQPVHVPKPAPPIVMSTPTLKPNPPPGNVIVVDTGRLKEVMKENSQMSAPAAAAVAAASSGTTSKKKKKKNKRQAENGTPTIEVPLNSARFGSKMPESCPPLGRGVTMLPSMGSKKMVPSLENQQATIIKTSDNMVTIRSPALQQAMNIHAYQNSYGYKPTINGYTNMGLFNEEVSRINDRIGNLKLAGDSGDKLTRQMRNLKIQDGNRPNEIFTHAMAAATNQQNSQTTSKKKRKKKKAAGKSGEEREVEPVESVFQPKDIDLENGDIDDDERELEAFKRFCLQSVPSERKNKVKVNLNIKDIVLKKKASAIGCS